MKQDKIFMRTIMASEHQTSLASGELQRCILKTGSTGRECGIKNISCQFGPAFKHLPDECPLIDGTVIVSINKSKVQDEEIIYNHLKNSGKI